MKKVLRKQEVPYQKTEESLDVQKALLSVMEDLNVEKLKLQETKARDEAILFSIGDGLIVTNKEGRLLLYNRRAKVLMGWGDERILGKLWVELVLAEDDTGVTIPFKNRPIYLALTSGIITTNTTYYYTKRDKTKFPVAITVTPMILNEKIIGAVEVFRDITHEKEIDAAKAEFISTVSHELRTPLAITIEAIGVVVDEIMGKITEKQREALLVAQDNLHRLTTIINQMLDIAKIESGKMEIYKRMVDMVGLVQKTVDIFKTKIEKKGLQLRILSPKKMIICADSDKISQVLINLISNSIKFTNTGSIKVSIKELSDNIQCSVSDTGIGIAKKDLPFAFSKFQQFERKIGPKEKGTGLGLAICKAIVTLHEGTIWIESEKGKGTSVTFTLPKRSKEKNKKITASHK